MNDQKKEPFLRWQGRSLEYLSYAINLFLGLSIAAIGFETSLLQNTEFKLGAALMEQVKTAANKGVQHYQH